MTHFQTLRDPWVWLLTWLASMMLVAASLVAAEAKEPEPVKAPPQHAVLSNTLGGWYFAPKSLKEAYDAALARLETLQANLDEGRIPVSEARAELAELKTRLEALRREIEASKVLVEGAKIHEQTETTEFELGEVRRLAITANQVRVLGWNKPRVRCELKKLVLSNDDQPVDTELNAIRIVHHHGRAEFAGKTPAEIDTEEQVYLAGDGAKLTDTQRASRRKLIDSMQRARSFYRDFQAQEIDQVTIAGLDYEENKVITLSVRSDGGGGQMGSVRRRYAVLTVYVPACEGVCLRGAMRGLSVEGLAAPLLIDAEGSTDEDHRAAFSVEGLRGSLTARNVPLKQIGDVEGRVEIVATTQFDNGGAGTSHRDEMRHMQPSQLLPVRIHNVRDGVQLWYGRANLDLSEIGGTIDVRNDFGNTHLVVKEPLPQAAHRIVSESGRIDVELSRRAFESIPVNAVTNHGSLKTNLAREVFEDFHLTSHDETEGARLSWTGFRAKSPNADRFAAFQLPGRFRAAINNTDRTPALDLISRGGSVVVMLSK